MNKKDFIDKYIPQYIQKEAIEHLDDIIEDACLLATQSEISSPKEHTGYTIDGINILEIGEDGEDGFYVVTGDIRKAKKIAKKYCQDDNSFYDKEFYDSCEKTKMHIYTKPWNTEYKDWYWYKENSDNPKACWVVKFSFY